MEEGLPRDAHAEGTVGRSARSKGLVVGLIAGLMATVLIDLVLMAYLVLTGHPADAGFALIGDTAAGFVSLFGRNMAAGVLPGLVWHYLIGLALGVIFGAAVTRFDALRLDSMKKGVGLGILYAEAISVPLLIMPPIILEWSASATAQLLRFYFVMHAFWGIFLGAAVSYGLRPSDHRRRPG